MSDLHEEAVKKKASSSSRKVRYEECSKNHKASQGDYATDGCMGFMASDASLLCDACGCHRNFHKVKAVEEEEDGNSRAVSEVRYTECRKNHALRMGKNSYKDGCMEFMASDGDEEVAAAGSTAALKCGACGCHRNFHRREEEIVRKPSPPSYSGRRRAMYDSDDY